MPNTLNRRYPFPERTVTPDVQLDLQRLAEALDTDVTSLLTTLPYRAESLAELNAKQGPRIFDRGVVNGSSIAADNGEYVYTGTGWKQQNVVRDATLMSTWPGSVKWVRSGSIITVIVSVTRSGATLNLAAWAQTRIASGLPLPAPAFLAQTPAETNRTTEMAYSLISTSDGNVDLVARLAARSVEDGTWVRGQFQYQEA